MKRLITTVAACACAFGLFADVIYVAPDGAGSGASWSDSASITAAFAAAVEAEGGEIWLKEGIYTLGATLVPCSNLVVRGGFAGTESSATEADPKAHLTILSAMNKSCAYGWTKNGTRDTTDPIWTADGKFNLMRADDVETVYRIPCLSNAGMGLTTILKTTVAVTGLRLDGLVFTCSRGRAVSFPTGSDCEVSRCLFLACGVVGSGAPVAGALESSGTLVVSDSDFIGCGTPLWFSGTATDATNKVVNCRFEDNTGSSGAGYGGALTTTGVMPLEITGCTFRRNIGVARANGSLGAAAIALTVANQKVKIADCLFEDNRCRTTGTSTALGCIYSKGSITIENCMFKGNSVKGTGLSDTSQTTSAACINANGTLIVRNTVFAGNWISAETSLSIPWSIVFCGSGTVGGFVNCSFYDNEVAVTGTTDAAKAGLWSATFGMGRQNNGNDKGKGVTLLNCLFSNNALASNVTAPEDGYLHQAEVLLCDSGTYNGDFTYSLVNTVVWNASADYQSYCEHPKIDPWITHCDFVNCGDVAARTNGTTCIEYLTADDPHISPKVCRKRGTYPFKGMLGLALDSPFGKSGTPVYEKNGTFYINEPGVGTKNPWRPCTNKAASSATLDGATLVADGFGAARSADAFSYGPVVNRLPGLAVMLK